MFVVTIKRQAVVVERYGKVCGSRELSTSMTVWCASVKD